MRKEELQTTQTLLESEKRKVEELKAAAQADGDKCKVEFETEVMKLKAQRSEDSVKITDLEAKIRELASDKERLEETAQVTMQEISERLASTTDLSETLRSEKAQLEKKFTELSTSSQVLESSLPKLKSQRDELTDQVAKMTVIIDELKSELKIAADANAVEEKMRKEELQTTQTLLESEKRKVEELKAVAQADGDKCKVEFETEVMKLKAQSSEDSVKITDLEANLKRAADEKSRLNGEKAQLDRRVAELSGAISSRQREIDALKSEKDNTTSLQSTIAQLESELKGQKQRADRQISELNTVIGGHKSKSKELRAELDDLKSELKAMSKEKSIFDRTIADLESQIGSLERKIVDGKTEYATATVGITTLISEVAQLQAEKAKIVESMEVKARKGSMQIQSTNEAKKEFERLRADLQIAGEQSVTVSSQMGIYRAVAIGLVVLCIAISVLRF